MITVFHLWNHQYENSGILVVYRRWWLFSCKISEIRFQHRTIVSELTCFFAVNSNIYVSSLCQVFYRIFISHQMITLQKLWKRLFVSSKKLISFSRYSHFCIPSAPLFFPVSHCFRGWSKINLTACDVINCLNKNLITHFVWYLEKEKSYDIEIVSTDRVFNKEHFIGKSCRKCASEVGLRPLFNFVK